MMQANSFQNFGGNYKYKPTNQSASTSYRNPLPETLHNRAHFDGNSIQNFDGNQPPGYLGNRPQSDAR
jgi:hypothetical protein